MIALFLVIALFLYLAFIGQAVVSLLRPRLSLLRSWLIAPTVGLALIVTLITRLSVWGLPVGAFGLWLTMVLFAAAGAVLRWRRPKFPWRQLAPFLLISVGSVLYFGWPLLRFGFNWVSYGNDDMANYCLAADRFLHHGYYELPRPADLEGRDYTQVYWFLHALGQIRPGADLTLAWVASTTGLNVHQAFMPTILAFSLLQLSALGALAMRRGRHRRIALAAVLFLAVSPLFGLGTLYQLIAQVGGLALFLAAAAVLFSTNRPGWRKILLAGVLASGLGIFYPEVSPFLVLGLVLFTAVLARRDGTKFKRYAFFLAFATGVTLVLLGSNICELFSTLLMQSSRELNGAKIDPGIIIFPWSLVPSYIPVVFGFHAYGEIGKDPLLSIQIAIGIALLACTLWAVGRGARRSTPEGCIGVVMLLLGAVLYFKKNDFGLFKLAMFAQPVIALNLAHGLLGLSPAGKVPGRHLRCWLMAAAIALTVPTSIHYAYVSLGNQGGGLCEAVGASRLGVALHLPEDVHYDAIDSDISNVVIAKMLTLYTRGSNLYFLSRYYFEGLYKFPPAGIFPPPDPGLKTSGRYMEAPAWLGLFFPEKFLDGRLTYRQPQRVYNYGNYWSDADLGGSDRKNRLFIALRPDLDAFNKLNPDGDWSVQNLYQYKPETQLHNRLVFVHSKLGQQYYGTDRAHVGVYQNESDPAHNDETTFHGTGRYNVFEVINPSPQFRMMVDFTCSPLGPSRSQLPVKAVVLGDKKYPLPFAGHGSARVVSPPLRPATMRQKPYLTIDFDKETESFATPKTGLMRLYGVGISLDDRRLVGFTRDISLLTEEQYRALPRPEKISQFPQDLMKYPGLEYSGIFEDGWTAQDSYFKLGPSRPGQQVNLKGYVPDIARFRAGGIDLTTSIDGIPAASRHLPVGEFDLALPVQQTQEITSITLHFSDAEVYNASKDLRAVSAFMREISITDSPPAANSPSPRP